jgi:hypothetical protein
VAVITTCRSVAGFFHLLRDGTSLKMKIYRAYFRLHSYYWVAFAGFLVLHLMVTVVHIGVPSPGEPYALAHQFVFYSAIANLVLAAIVFTSCRSFLSLYALFSTKIPLNGSFFKRFYNTHAVLWVLLISSILIHIIAGVIHAVNT